MKYVKDISAFVNCKHVFCGIDVHQKHWAICMFCDGIVVEKIKIEANYILLKSFLIRYRSARKVNCVCEAAFSGFWLCRKLQADGFSCIVTPPGLIPKMETKVFFNIAE